MNNNLINTAEKKAVQKQRDCEPAHEPALPSRRSWQGRCRYGRNYPRPCCHLAHGPGPTSASPVLPPAQGEPLATRGNSASLPSCPRGRVPQGLSPADSEADPRPRPSPPGSARPVPSSPGALGRPAPPPRRARQCPGS